jgi:hypothetical protein
MAASNALALDALPRLFNPKAVQPNDTWPRWVPAIMTLGMATLTGAFKRSGDEQNLERQKGLWVLLVFPGSVRRPHTTPARTKSGSDGTGLVRKEDSVSRVGVSTSDRAQCTEAVQSTVNLCTSVAAEQSFFRTEIRATV